MVVKITNGVNVFEVPSGAYEGIFKFQGYVAMQDDSASSAASESFERPAKRAKLDALDEKPVSQWTKQELKAYCSGHGILLDGVARVEDVRRKVLEYQERRVVEE